MPGPGVHAAHQVIRKYIDHLDEDRPLFPDNDAIVKLLMSGELLEAVENAVGNLD